MLVQIHLRASKLGNISPSSWRGKKSNPYAKITRLSSHSNHGSSTNQVIVGYTETIPNNLSPIWTTIFTVDHDEHNAWTPLRISVYDYRGSSRSTNTIRMKNSNESSILPRRMAQTVPEKGDGMMGEVDLEVGNLLRGGPMEFQLNEGGSLFVHITPSINSNFQASAISGLFTAQLRGLDFQNIESGLLGLGAIDPYFELSKRYHNPSNGTERWQIVYRSEYIHNVINPYWDPFQLDLTKLCHGEVRRELKITVYDYETMSAHRKLGETKVTVEELMESVTTGGNASREDALRVVDEEGDVVGLLVVLKAQIANVVEDDHR